MCPTRHLLWDCAWVNERCRPVPPALQASLQDPQQQELWLRGWTHLPPMPQRIHGHVSLHGAGVWETFECIDHEPHLTYGIAVALVGKDKRIRQQVVAVCVAADGPEGLRKIGSVTALVAPPFTLERGYLLGLTMLIQHTDGTCRVGIPHKTVRLWKQGLPFSRHNDILNAVTQEWHGQIRIYTVDGKQTARQWRARVLNHYYFWGLNPDLGGVLNPDLGGSLTPTLGGLNPDWGGLNPDWGGLISDLRIQYSFTFSPSGQPFLNKTRSIFVKKGRFSGFMLAFPCLSFLFTLGATLFEQNDVHFRQQGRFLASC